MSKPTRRGRTASHTADEVFELLLSDWVRVAIHARIADLLKATIDAAVGVRHVYTKDPSTQQWTRVTDPDALAAVLKGPGAGVLDCWTTFKLLVSRQRDELLLLPASEDLGPVMLIGRRRTKDVSDPDHSVTAIHDVRAMTTALYPAIDHPLCGRLASCNVLPHGSAGIPGLRRTDTRRPSVWARVRKKVVRCHVGAVATRCLSQMQIEREW
jgi:hypothetical protein